MTGSLRDLGRGIHLGRNAWVRGHVHSRSADCACMGRESHRSSNLPRHPIAAGGGSRSHGLVLVREERCVASL